VRSKSRTSRALRDIRGHVVESGPQHCSWSPWFQHRQRNGQRDQRKTAAHGQTSVADKGFENDCTHRVSAGPRNLPFGASGGRGRLPRQLPFGFTAYGVPVMVSAYRSVSQSRRSGVHVGSGVRSRAVWCRPGSWQSAGTFDGSARPLVHHVAGGGARFKQRLAIARIAIAVFRRPT